MVAILNKLGTFPSRYWAEGNPKHWEKLTADYLLEHFDDGQWHTLSLRDLSNEIDVPKSSVHKVLVRLDTWGLISRNGGSRGVPGKLRIHARKIRQQLKHGGLSADDQLPWLH